MRFINNEKIIAAQMTTPEENPLVTDDTRLMDIWFGGAVIRKQMFKKVTKAEQQELVSELLQRGFIQSERLYIDPAAVFFAEMEHELIGGIVTIGYQENGKPLELKVSGQSFLKLCEALRQQGAPK